jgi:hypothetical protein
MTLSEILALPLQVATRLIKASDTEGYYLIDAGATGATATEVASAGRTVKHAIAAGTSYIGTAAAGSLVADPVWTITKIVVAADGSCTTSTATGVNWTDYLTHTYAP